VRSFSASWFDLGWRSREKRCGAIIAPIREGGGTRISVFDRAPGQDAANRNCRETRQLDVSLRPVSRLQGDEVKEFNEAKKDDFVCR
jgi:hypothetical protein